MNICFENKEINAYREIMYKIQKTQATAESVVPDTNDDIGKIASVHTSVMMKSKDITSRGIIVIGEVYATLLYITENENDVSYIKMNKSFTLEYDAEDIPQDSVAQINLNVSNIETRILNPRKVSVTIEISGELECYAQEPAVIYTALPENSNETIHAKFETCESIIINCACEKTFAINEQFVFPGGKPAPAQLVSQNLNFSVNETQLVGNKVVVKGNVNLSVCYLSNEVDYPVQTEFNSPFSQIVDIGRDLMDDCSAVVILTSAYYELVDTISNEKALDAELHAVIQIVSRCRQELGYISDVYSNLMPVECNIKKEKICDYANILRTKLSSDYRISIVEDCMDVLSIFPYITQVSATDNKLAAAVALDTIYRTKNNTLSSARRMLNLEGECLASPGRIVSQRISDIYLRPDGAFVEGHISVEICYLSSSNSELNRVIAVEMIEEEAYDLNKFPTVSLVRGAEESLWDLAKQYHSSVECINLVNNIEEGIKGKMLLIPKEV